MKTFVNYIFTGFFLTISCFITGCIDDPVMPNGNFISGSIYDQFGAKMDVGVYDGFFISPGNAPITILSNPDFSINSFSLPYDFVISSEFSRYTIKFQDININNISPVYQYEPFRNWDSRRIFIKFPMIRKKTVLYIKFLSESLHYQVYSLIRVEKGDTLAHTIIYIPSESNKKITGDVLYLEADDFSNFPQISFNHFGIKPVDSLDYENIVEFSESDISYDPIEVKSSFTNIPPGAINGEGRVSLSFQGEPVYSNLILYEGLPDNCIVNIPLLPGIKYNVTYTGLYNGGNLGGGTKDIIVSPEENGVVTHKLAPVIVSPAQNDSNVTPNSDFKITDDNSPGVFKYEFFCYVPNSYEKKITIFSNRRSLKFSDICARGFEFQSGAQYLWRVIKIPGFINVDELLGTIYTTDPRYNGIEGSQFKAFFTR